MAYRTEQDVVGRWIADRCEIGPNQFVSSSDLYTNFRDWCKQEGERELSNNAFSRRLAALGYDRAQHFGGIRGRVWLGIGLIDSDEQIRLVHPDPTPDDPTEIEDSPDLFA